MNFSLRIFTSLRAHGHDDARWRVGHLLLVGKTALVISDFSIDLTNRFSDDDNRYAIEAMAHLEANDLPTAMARLNRVLALGIADRILEVVALEDLTGPQMDHQDDEHEYAVAFDHEEMA